MEAAKKEAHKVEANAAPLTRIIQAGEIDDIGLGIALCIIEDHPRAGTNPPLCITEGSSRVIDVDPSSGVPKPK